MKKIFYGFLALAGLAMVSCSQEIDEQINANTDSVKKIFTANTEDGASTRTSIALEEQTGNYVVIWNGEEKIAVNGVDYKVIDGAGSKNVTFGADVQGVEAATAEVYNAVYPNTAWVEGSLNLEHLKQQTALNATYGHGYAVTVSTTTKSDMDFKFKNALSFLRVRFSLADDAKEDAITIKTVTITADDYLWGSASDVNYATGEIGAVTNSGEAGKRIVYTAGEDVLLDRGENAIFDAVIAVPVNAEGRTLTIEITGENAWTGTPYTYKAEGVTKKYLRNTVTTLAKAIKPVEVQYVAEGVIRNNEGEWIISSVAGMEWFREQVESGKNVFKGQVVKLGDNIDLVSVANFAPISYENYFEGTFDGQNYTISNLNIARENDWCLGLFGAAKGATFKNIVFENANVAITNSSFAEGNGGMFGLLCGYATGTTTIDNITVNGIVKLQGETTHQGGQRIGTMIGHNVGNLTISNVTVDVEEGSYVSGYCFVGGVIGQAQGKVVAENVKSNIDVKGVQYHAGGLVGQIDNLATLTNCSSSANVSLSGARPIATTINDIARIGGILGGVNGSSTDKVTLTGCTFTGTLSSKTTADEVATAFDCRGLVGRSWGVNGGQVIIDGVVFEHIAGTDVYIVDGVYEIMGKAGMLWFANEVNVNANKFSGKTVKVIADIDMTGAAWAPVGQTGATQFHGTFDGQNKTIKGLTISAPASYSTNYATGMFGWVETGAVIKNIVLDGAAINGYHYVGAIAGYTGGKAKIEGCEVKNSAIVADPNKKDTAGEFNGDKVGGIVGFTNGTNVINGNKVSNTTLKGYRHIGGIVGYLYGTAENNSVENVTITVDNSNNYKGYEIQSKYGVNSIAGVMSGTSNNNTGEATIEWGEIPAEKLTAVQALNKQIAEGATTITLTENIVAEDGESIVIPNGKEVTIDLAGYTISQEMVCTASYVLVSNNGTLVIEDSSDAKTGTIIVTDNGAGDSSFGWGTYTVRNSGTLTINGGTIKNVKKAEVAHCAVPLMLYSGKTTINEGANIISANYRTIQGFHNPEVIINGGNFEGQVWMHETCSADASLTINGGTFAPRGNDGSSVFLNNTNDIKLTITGGYFTTKVGCDDDTKSGVQNAITGGTFTEAAVNGGKTKQLIAEGYAAIANGDGTYTVTTFVPVASVDGVEYESVEEAFTAALAADSAEEVVITLVDDAVVATDASIVLTKGNIKLDLAGKTLSADNTRTATHNFLFDVKGGELTVENGTIEYTHTGSNMAWNGATTVIDVTAGGVLNLEGVKVINNGGTDMNFAVHLNNWGEVTVNANNCEFVAPYCAFRVFNSGYDMNNVTITNSKFQGDSKSFWVHNFIGDLNSAQHSDEAIKARLNLDIYGNGNTFISNNPYRIIEYGFSNPINFDAEGNFVVRNAKALQYALGEAVKKNAGNTTINIEKDLVIDMSAIAWEPVYVNGQGGVDVVTLKGNGATLKGLSAALFKGGFAGHCGIVVSDLTIKDSTMSATNTTGYGAFVCAADSMDKVVLTNCHADGVNITTPAGAESRMGGLIGWTAGYSESYPMTVTVEGCSVKNSTIDGFGSVGGIIGHAGNNAYTNMTINNCVVENNTLNSTDDGAWRVGAVVGTANVGSLVITNTTVSGNTISQVGKTAPEGLYSNYYGRFVPGTTGSMSINGVNFIANAAQFKAAVAAKEAEIYVAGVIDLKDVVLAGYNGTITGVTANAALSTRNFVPAADEAYQLGGSKITFKNLAIQLPTSIDWIKSGFVHGDDIVFEKCAFEGQATLNGNGNYTFNECEFVSPVSGNYASFVYGVNKAIFNKCAFSGVDRAAKVYATGGDLDIEYKGCTYTSTTTNKAGVEIDATYATTVVYFDKHCSQTGMNGLYAVKGSKATVTVEGTANSGFSADVDGEIVIW